jgi:phosphoglycerate kinase
MKQVEPDTGEMKFADADAIEKGWDALDIGPKTREEFGRIIREEAEDRLLERPDGLFREGALQRGHARVAQALADTRRSRWSAAATPRRPSRRWASMMTMSHVSTGGGASIEYVQGDVLPGVEALDEA